MLLCIAPARRCGRDLSNQGSRRHLATGHAVDAVVDKEYCQLLAPVGRLDGLVQANGSQIAVSLIGDDNGVVLSPGYACSNSRSAAMSGLYVTAVQIVVGENGAAHRTDHDAPILDAQVRHGLAYELMQNAVSATGTVMGGSDSCSAFSGKRLIYAGMPPDNFFLSRHS